MGVLHTNWSENRLIKGYRACFVLQESLKPEHLFSLNLAKCNYEWDTELSKDTIVLQPGDFYTSTRGDIISTTLGSCIAACVRDRDLGIGGMNHFMLPTVGDGDNANWELTSVNAGARYGTYAMECLINMILKKGGKRNKLEFKFFGGGNVLGSATNIGETNIRFIREFMEAEGYSVESECLGRPYPIKLHYFSNSGVAKIKKLTNENIQVVAVENRYAGELERKLKTHDIELFKTETGDK